MNRLFCFGLGYSAMALARRLAAKGDWTIQGTVTTAEGVALLEEQGFPPFLFDGEDGAHVPLRATILDATHVLVSVPPDDQGDPVLRSFAEPIQSSSGVRWIGYLSTIGVYGDHHGAWVDEASEPRPVSKRSIQRLTVENAWRALDEGDTGRRVHIFRLAGIYGPGRSAIEKVRAGTARRVIKPGQVFNRIHVDDIATVLAAAIGRPARHAIYNVADDDPAPPQDVILHAAGLLGMAPPPEVAFEKAELSPMAASFWTDTKRVSNDRIKSDLGVTLAYPTYREGLAAILRDLGHR